MTDLLSDELVRRAAGTFDEAEVLRAVHRKIAARRVRRQRATVAAAGLLVVALVLGAVTFGRHSPHTASAPAPGVVVSAAPAVAVDAAVLESSATVIRHRLADVPGVSVDTSNIGGIVVRGPSSARDQITAAVDTMGQFTVRPVLAVNTAVAPPRQLSSLPAQPSGSSADEQTWRSAAIAAARANALPCIGTLAFAGVSRPLFSCNASDGSVAVLGQAVVAGPVTAEVVQDPAGQAGRVLSVTFDAADQSSFTSYTARHAGSSIGFLIDNQTLSAPAINSAITTSTVTIASTGSEDQLRRYARALTEPLPVGFVVTDISATR